MLGSYFGTFTPGANVFLVYAGAFCCRLGNPRRAVIGLTGIVAWTLGLSWIYELSYFFYVPGLLFTLMIGGVNIYQAEIEKKRKQLLLSQEEVKTLARTAERERIARDLHDLIGHTFSVITLKAELAGKLVDKDLGRAKDEIKQLENISRDALKQVREVVTGFRSSDLNDEFAHAKFTLESNDINFQYQCEDIEIDDTTNKELAIILKELITNILKHAQASKVSATLSMIKDRVTLEVQDNGVGIKADEKKQDGLWPKRDWRKSRKTQGNIFHFISTLANRQGGDIYYFCTRGVIELISIVIAEDQGMILGALAALLDLEDDIEVLFKASDGQQALEFIENNQAQTDILITDIEMPNLTGLDLAQHIQEKKLKVRTIILTTFSRSGYLRRAMDSGVKGYLLKDSPSDELIVAIRKVASGGKVVAPELMADAWMEQDPLTDKERQALRLAKEGETTEQIASKLHLSAGTVRKLPV